MGMRRRAIFALMSSALATGGAHAAEVTVKNDSLTDFGSAVIVTGFTASEKAASWLTSPCDGNVRAVQVFWRSFAGNTPPEFGEAIEIYRAGTFPNPGALAEEILGPVLTDGVLNEFRFLDENNTVPLNVPVVANETFVVALDFDVAPPASIGPSVVRDTDGCQANRNAIHAELAPGTNVWFSSCALGVGGDFVIRGVVDCAAVGSSADVSASMFVDSSTFVPGQLLTYTIAASNAGPGASNGTMVSDTFPAALTNVAWACVATGGATCPTPATGLGNLAASVNLPAGGATVFTVTAVPAAGTTSPIVNSVAVFPGSGVSDPNVMNNTASATTSPAIDPVFENSFE